MECSKHKDVKAKAICVSCGIPICEECDTVIKGKHYCDECKKEFIKDPEIEMKDRRINGFLWFAFSLMPGAGHMYMGLMNRGIMLLGLFLGVVVVDNIIFGRSIVAIISLLVYIYAFFDSLAMKRAIERGLKIEDKGFDNLSLGKINLYYVGVGIIGLGVLTLIDVNVHHLNLLPVVRQVIYAIRSSVLPILMILAGLWLMKRSKKEEKFDGEEE